MINESLTQIRNNIQNAFASMHYPGDTNITNMIPNLDSDRVRTRAYFRGKEWDRLTIDDLYDYSLSLFDMTSTAFRYYLPVYMLAATTLIDPFPERLVGYLSPSYYIGVNREWFDERMNGFTNIQKDSIYEFVKFIKNNVSGLDITAIDTAMEYWQQMSKQSNSI